MTKEKKKEEERGIKKGMREKRLICYVQEDKNEERRLGKGDRKEMVNIFQ